jgi:hypothetical protein
MGTYSTNPQVIHETIEGETIIIDLVSGTYYSLQGSGPEIWHGVAEGESAAAIVERLAHVYAGDRGEIAAAVAEFLGELEAERLIAAAEAGANGVGPVGEAVTAIGSNGHGAAFAPPKLEKYTDMQDIILLDPVHQVDDRGWPHGPPRDAA